MTNAKMTKKDYFNAILAIPQVSANPELVDFINHELELLAKKNSSRKGELTETQKENIALGEEIVQFMAKRELTTIAEIRKHFGVSSQKVTPIMTSLEKAGRINRTIDKRVSYFSVA